MECLPHHISFLCHSKKAHFKFEWFYHIAPNDLHSPCVIIRLRSSGLNISLNRDHLKLYTHIQWCWLVCGGQTTQQQPTMFDERYWSTHALTQQCWNKVGESNINETNRNVQWMLDWQVFDENQTCNEHRLTLLNIVQQWWSYCWIDWISRMMFSEMLRFNVYLVDGSMVILRGPSAMAVEVWTTQADIWDKFSLKVVFWIWI